MAKRAFKISSDAADLIFPNGHYQASFIPTLPFIDEHGIFDEAFFKDSGLYCSALRISVLEEQTRIQVGQSEVLAWNEFVGTALRPKRKTVMGLRQKITDMFSRRKSN